MAADDYEVVCLVFIADLHVFQEQLSATTVKLSKLSCRTDVIERQNGLHAYATKPN